MNNVSVSRELLTQMARRWLRESDTFEQIGATTRAAERRERGAELLQALAQPSEQPAHDVMCASRYTTGHGINGEPHFADCTCVKAEQPFVPFVSDNTAEWDEQLRREHEQPGDVGGHRAEFLYGAADGSPEFHGYEFANGKTEEYRRMHWDALIAALSPSVPAEAVAWIIPGDDSARDDGSLDAMVYKTGEFTVPLYKHPAPANDEAVRFPVGGYAPGGYECICFGCRMHFYGDKRAVQCFACAKGVTEIPAFLASQHKEKGNG